MFPTQNLNFVQEYWVDAWQRSILSLDVLRERGNIYLEHNAQNAPNVLSFAVRARSATAAPCRGRSTTCSSASCRRRTGRSIRPSRPSSSSIRAPAMGLASAA